MEGVRRVTACFVMEIVHQFIRKTEMIEKGQEQVGTTAAIY